MRKRIYLLLLVAGLLSACESNNDFYEPFTTDLRVFVEDSAGRRPVPGARVMLFRSKTDFEALKTPVADTVTNSRGVAVFNDLSSVNYYIYASATEGTVFADNSGGDFNMGQELVAGSVTAITLAITPKRNADPKRLIFKELWLMAYESDLDTTKRLLCEFYGYDYDYDEYYKIGQTIFGKYESKLPVSESNAKSLGFNFGLNNIPDLYVATSELQRKSRNEVDTVPVSWDYVDLDFALKYYPRRLRIAEYQEVTLDLKLVWR